MRARWFILTAGAVIVVVLFAFPLWWPVVNRSPAADALPDLVNLPPEEQDVIEGLLAEDFAFAEALVTHGVAEPVAVPPEEQEMPALLSPTLYASGEFSEIDAVRWARGTVSVYQDADGSWLIRLEDFEVRSGPQLHLFLSAHPSPRTPEEVRAEGLGFDWGPLRGTVGSQNYILPAEFDMDAVQSVVIFSIPFQEVFSSAQLFR